MNNNMTSLTAIRKLCEDGLFDNQSMIREIKLRVANDKLLSALWERGMEVATTDEQRQAVMYMIMSMNEECKEIFAMSIYYSIRASK